MNDDLSGYKHDLTEYNIRETRSRIKRSIKNFSAFIGCILIGVGLWIQVITQWNMNPVVVIFASLMTVVFVILAFYSLWRLVSE